MKEWMRAHRREIVFVFIIFLVASLSFGMGYLFSRDSRVTPIVIEKVTD